MSSEEDLIKLFNQNKETVKRWVREDIFKYDYLIFPLNMPEHWSVIIITNPKMLFETGELQDS